MSQAPTTDFFDRLEGELRRAATRPPRSPAPRGIAVVAVVLAVGVLALVPIALVGGGSDVRRAPNKTGPALPPVGTILPKGSGDPPRTDPTVVVAQGRTKVAGLWQLEVSRYAAAGPKSKEPAMQAGFCLLLYLPLNRSIGGPSQGGYCGPGDLGFRGTPGFSRQQTMLPPRKARVVLVFGRAPARASKIVVTAPSGLRREVEPLPAPPALKRFAGFGASFYLVVVRPTEAGAGARINWLDAADRPGSRGIRLMPPLTPMKR
jgi:hypothetical protein